MPVDHSDVKPAHRAAGAAGLGSYARWRATTLGQVTEALEHRSIFKLMGPVEGKRVIDLGCGDGLLGATLARQGALVVGVDVDRSVLRAANSRGAQGPGGPPRFIEGPIERLPFDDSVFDVAVAMTVLCLVADPTAALREAARVVRPGGTLIIGELGRWNTWAARRRVKGWFGSRLWRSAHVFSASQLSGLVEDAGLTVSAVRGSVFYPPVSALAPALASLDEWLGSVTTIGAAFIAVAATKSVTAVNDSGSRTADLVTAPS
jgi:SAM-dependent methyltransferase